jgi:TolB protein
MQFFLMLLICSNYVFAQDKIGVIAVGEAGEEIDKICLLVNPNLSSKVKEIRSVIANDFLFYKHRFETSECSDSEKSNYKYVISLQESGKINVQVTTTDKKTILSKDYATNQGRELSHMISEDIYFAISGKHSIFRSKIAFVSDRSSKGRDTRKELYMMDFDGHKVERLTFFDSTVISPSVSPDNSKIMFSVIGDHREKSSKGYKILKNIDLKVLDLRTKKFASVSSRPGINSGASFDASGKNIYFTMSFGGNADIYEMNLATSSTRRITTSMSEDVDPSITRDGKLMSFLSNRAGRAHIYTMDPSGTEKDVKRISFVGQFNATPRFSHDGKEIVFVSWVDRGFDLYRIDSAGSNLVRLTKNFGSNEEPSISPDGEFIIFTSQRVLSQTSATQDIYIMNRDGEIVGQLTQGFGKCYSPRWTN